MPPSALPLASHDFGRECIETPLPHIAESIEPRTALVEQHGIDEVNATTAEGERMGIVFIDIGMSLDGFVAGPNGRPGNPLGDGGTRIHEWVYRLAAFREQLGLGGGETGQDDAIIRGVLARAGAYVMGRRMFDEGYPSGESMFR